MGFTCCGRDLESFRPRHNRNQPCTITVWDIAKWLVLLIIAGLVLAILFWASPNAKHGFQWVSRGGFTVVVLWLIASALFALFGASFGHYSKITAACWSDHAQ